MEVHSSGDLGTTKRCYIYLMCSLPPSSDTPPTSEYSCRRCPLRPVMSAMALSREGRAASTAGAGGRAGDWPPLLTVAGADIMLSV